MPMPEPKAEEKKQEFLNRCMGNNVMNDEYPDEKQRYAVCQSIWDKEKKTMSKQRETRTFELDELEVRAAEGEEQPKIRGHAAVFNKLSEDLGGFREKIAPGAFVETIKKSDIRALWNHNPDWVLGRNKSGTLHLEEDEKGLYIEISPPDAQWARDLMESIRRKDVSQMSFAFATIEDSWEHKKGDASIRTLVKAELFDVSPVTYPAYPQTDLKVRSVLAEAGIDFDALCIEIEQRRQGNSDNSEVISKAIEVLRSYIREAEKPVSGGACVEGGEAAGNDGYVRWVEKTSRLLKLLELENT